MSFAVKGWCPGALRPMLSGDGLVVRIRPRMARLTPDQARGLATAALTHGNGLLDLTARANVQLRGIRPEAHLALLDDLDALDLIDTDEASERHRNIVVSPFWTDGDGSQAVAQAAMAVLTDPEFSFLSGKFGVSVDPAQPVLQAVSSDIRIERHGLDWLVRPDGFAMGAVVTDVAAALRLLLRWCRPQGRMAALAGMALPPGFDTPVTQMPFAAAPGAHELGQMVGFEFGQVRAETLMALANYPIRVTPWRMILLEGATAVDLPDLIVTPDDHRLNVTACTGAPGCPQALQPTRDLARHLSPLVQPGQHLHVSGCAKGCAHPGPSDLTLTATEQGYDLIRNGRAGDAGDAFTSITLLNGL